MGRIKTSFIKNLALDLYEKHADKFTTEFSKNKEILPVNPYFFVTLELLFKKEG